MKWYKPVVKKSKTMNLEQGGWAGGRRSAPKGGIPPYANR